MKKLTLTLASFILFIISHLAIAGGPATSLPTHGIFFGFGGAYNFVQYEEIIQDFGGNLGTLSHQNLFGLSPIGQLGYDYYGTSRCFLGIKGLFTYLDKMAATRGAAFTNQGRFNSMVAAMLEAGFLYGDNAFYGEAGYSVLYSTQKLGDVNALGVIIATQNRSYSGGIIGLGYRHFWGQLFIDVAYSFSLYEDWTPLTGIALGGQSAGNLVTVRVQRPRVQNLAFTLNYLFNV